MPVDKSRHSDGAEILSPGENWVWLDSLARRYSPALHRFFSRKIDQKCDVPDLVQEVFVRLARISEPDQIREPESYLFKTASNTLRDHLRRGRVRMSDQQEKFDPERHGETLSVPADAIEDRQAIERLQTALRELPERTRDVFVLRALEDMRTVPVARSLGISTRSVEKHYAKALAHLAVALAAFRD